MPDHARAFLERVAPGQEPLRDALVRDLARHAGITVRREDWRPDQVPDHLRMTFRVVDEPGRNLAQGKDLAALQDRLRGGCGR